MPVDEATEALAPGVIAMGCPKFRSSISGNTRGVGLAIFFEVLWVFLPVCRAQQASIIIAIRFQIRPMNQFPCAILLALCASGAAAQINDAAAASSLLSERDFLEDMPVVLSVSRLAQPLDEAPGAVTILDRNYIRNSGARDVADLLRVVPGFQTTTSFETDAPMASYHGRIDDWSNRIQVLVDGRSVYSGNLQGSTGLGLQTLSLDDIERIEVLRGSNSAAYGARAFLGVINIVSRDARETAGQRVRLNAGDGGVADAYAAVGWGDAGTSYRLSADSRGDMGLRGAYGVNRVSRLNFSSAISLPSAASLELRAGSMGVDAGRGALGSPGNIARSRFLGTDFLQADLMMPLASDQDLQFSISQTKISEKDGFRFYDSSYPAPFQGVLVDLTAYELNQAISAQHTRRWSPEWRTVWGVELRQEHIDSATGFDGRGSVTNNFQRLFGNAEWRFQPDWVLNSGVMLEQSDIGGGTSSPRVMMNWHAFPGHTLRAGVSTAFRPPSAFEKYANVRYYDVNHNLLLTTVQSRGVVGPEKVESRELGYNLSLPRYGVSGDLRAFSERIFDAIEVAPKAVISDPDDYRNVSNYQIGGVEHQLQWKPSATSSLFLTQTWTTIEGAERLRVKYSAAKYAMSFGGQYTSTSGYVWTLSHAQSDEIALMSMASAKQPYFLSRTDMRVARPFQWGRHKAQLALTVQNLDQPTQDGDWQFRFDRRAYISFEVEQ
jgi:iron complex outermembrane receptor protein